MTNSFASIHQAIATLQAGRMIILMDDEMRENEGDLVIAAQYATPEAINFMSKYGRGLICLSMTGEQIDKLQLPMMAEHNKSQYGTAFTVSIEAACGVTTGISAQDRAHTVQVAINSTSSAEDIISPGHIFPLRAIPHGTLARAGQTEGSVDLTILAGLKPAAVICEIMNDNGSMSRREDLLVFSKQHNLPIVSIKDLIDYRISNETLVKEIVTIKLPLHNYGDFIMTVFENDFDPYEHFALVRKPKVPNQVPLVRIHSECITGDVFGSCKCDCGAQLHQALHQFAAEGGVLIYLRQEGRGIGLANKLKAYALQEQGYDTVEANLQLGFPADNRNYAVAYQILKYLGLDAIRLLTNNPQKVEAIEKYGLKVIERIPLFIHPTHDNLDYLKTKRRKLGHFLAVE